MASTTIVFGLLLTVLGLAGYVLSGTSSVTALIPAFLGVILMVLGLVARAEHLRKHAMHAAAMVAVIGFVGALFSLLRTPLALRPAMAVFSQAATVLLTGVFVGLCVRSFIAARRARRAG
jgi:uncharacterized membrane protein